MNDTTEASEETNVTTTDDAARLRKLADDRLAKLNAIAQIGAEPADAVLAIIKGEEPDPGAGTSDTSTMYHGSLAEFRAGLVSAAEAHSRATDEYRRACDKPREERSRAEMDAYASSLMASSYAYTLAAVLGYAEREAGPQTARMLANVADDILANGDDMDLNADVRHGVPLPPPTAAEQQEAGQVSIFEAIGESEAA